MIETADIAVVFDLDDTLYKERDFVDSGFRAVATAMAQKSGISHDVLYRTMVSAADAFDGLLDLLGKEYSIADFLKVYRFHRPVLALATDTEQTLTTLKNMGVTLGIITDGRSITQRNKIEALDIERFIPDNNIIISEEIGADKTTPNPFELFKLRVNVSRYYYIGDNPSKDFYWPNKLGWTTIMLRDTDGVNVHPQTFIEKDKIYRPKHSLDNITQICQLL